MNAASIARALGGDAISAREILAPGPGHSAKDRSLSVRIEPAAIDGFVCHSHAGDDWRACRDHVRTRLGLARADRSRRPAPLRPQPPRDDQPDQAGADKARAALAIWHESIDPRGTLAEAYLKSRGLELPDHIASSVIRWSQRIGAMVALYRDVRTDEPRAISRTFLDAEGRKDRRAFLGPVGGCAMKLDADEDVTLGLTIGEGIETCLAGRKMGFRPTWALGSAGAVAAIPVLPGIEALTILAETDDSGANARAIAQVAARWSAAGREVFVIEPNFAGDMNDVILKRARA